MTDRINWAMDEWLKTPSLKQNHIQLINNLKKANNISLSEFKKEALFCFTSLRIDITEAILIARAHGILKDWKGYVEAT